MPAADDADPAQLDLLAGAPRGGDGQDGLVTRERWGRLERQQPVAVEGLRGEYVFWAHVTNPASGDEWITVYGGRTGGVRQFRSVAPDKVRPKRTATRRRPQVEPVDQPSLDL